MPFQWSRPGEEMGNQTSHWHKEMGWEASCLGEPWKLLEKGVAQGLMYAILFFCFHISFVNNPFEIYLSLHVDNIQRCGSFCFCCSLFFVNSLRSGSPLSSSPHSTRTLLHSVRVVTWYSSMKLSESSGRLPKSCIQPSPCRISEFQILTNSWNVSSRTLLCSSFLKTVVNYELDRSKSLCKINTLQCMHKCKWLKMLGMTLMMKNSQNLLIVFFRGLTPCIRQTFGPWRKRIQVRLPVRWGVSLDRGCEKHVCLF